MLFLLRSFKVLVILLLILISCFFLLSCSDSEAEQEQKNVNVLDFGITLMNGDQIINEAGKFDFYDAYLSNKSAKWTKISHTMEGHTVKTSVFYNIDMDAPIRILEDRSGDPLSGLPKIIQYHCTRLSRLRNQLFGLECVSQDGRVIAAYPLG